MMPSDFALKEPWPWFGEHSRCLLCASGESYLLFALLLSFFRHSEEASFFWGTLVLWQQVGKQREVRATLWPNTFLLLILSSLPSLAPSSTEWQDPFVGSSLGRDDPRLHWFTWPLSQCQSIGEKWNIGGASNFFLASCLYYLSKRIKIWLLFSVGLIVLIDHLAALFLTTPLM